LSHHPVLYMAKTPQATFHWIETRSAIPLNTLIQMHNRCIVVASAVHHEIPQTVNNVIFFGNDKYGVGYILTGVFPLYLSMLAMTFEWYIQRMSNGQLWQSCVCNWRKSK